MWIAKNSVTGVTYGKKFDSIYDCQSFIDKELIILQYEFKKVFALEEQVLHDIEMTEKHASFFDIFSDALKSFENTDSIQEFKQVIKLSLQGAKQKEIDDYINRNACVTWGKNNIIRCWNVSQERFATGFDF